MTVTKAQKNLWHFLQVQFLNLYNQQTITVFTLKILMKNPFDCVISPSNSGLVQFIAQSHTSIVLIVRHKQKGTTKRS